MEIGARRKSISRLGFVDNEPLFCNIFKIFYQKTRQDKLNMTAQLTNDGKGGRILELDAQRELAAFSVLLFHYTTRYDGLNGHDKSLLFRIERPTMNWMRGKYKDYKKRREEAALAAEVKRS